MQRFNCMSPFFPVPEQVKSATGGTILHPNRAERWTRPSTNTWQEPGWEPNSTIISTASRKQGSKEARVEEREEKYVEEDDWWLLKPWTESGRPPSSALRLVWTVTSNIFNLKHVIVRGGCCRVPNLPERLSSGWKSPTAAHSRKERREGMKIKRKQKGGKVHYGLLLLTPTCELLLLHTIKNHETPHWQPYLAVCEQG